MKKFHGRKIFEKFSFVAIFQGRWKWFLGLFSERREELLGHPNM